MGGLSFPRTEPGENDRHTAPNRLAGVEPAELAGEQQRSFAFLLEIGDMRAVEVDFSAAALGIDFDLRQPSVSFHESDTPWNFQSSQLLRYFQACHNLAI